MATNSKIDSAFRMLSLKELFIYGDTRYEWVKLFVKDRTINCSHGFNFQGGISIGNVSYNAVPDALDDKVSLYVEDNQLKIKHYDGEVINLSDPMKPSGDIYSVQLKISDYQIGGDSNFIYDPTEQTLRVYNLAPVNKTSGMKFKLYNTESDVRDIISINKDETSNLESSFIFRLGDDKTNMTFDANKSSIENLGTLSFYPVGKDSYNETSVSPMVYCSSGGSVDPPFNESGSIIFQAKKGGDIIFATSKENESYKESIFVKDNSVTFQLRDSDPSVSPSINEFFSINQYNDTTQPDNYLRLRRTNGNNEWWDIVHTQDNNLEFRNSTGWKAIIRTNTTQNALNYVGRQIVQPSTNYPDFTQEQTGRIVSCTGLYNNEDEDMYTGDNSAQTVPSYDLALPIVKLSTQEKDKTTLGVVTRIEDISTTDRTFFCGAFGTSIAKNINRLIVSTSGVGAVWVCNYGGTESGGVLNNELNIGDYICCSGMNGYGMKQDDDILHSYTVAKSTMYTDFNGSPDYLVESFTYDNITYNAVLVGCIFLSG